MKFNNDRRIRGKKRTKMKVYCSCGHKTQGSHPNSLADEQKKSREKLIYKRKHGRKCTPACVLCIFVTINEREFFGFSFFWHIASIPSSSPQKPFRFGGDFYLFMSSTFCLWCSLFVFEAVL